MRSLASCFICLYLVSLPVLGDDSKVTFGVFGNLGLVTSSSDELGYRGEINSQEAVFKGDFDIQKHSKLGAQLEYVATDAFDIFAQALFHAEDDLDLDSALNIMFLRYRINDNFSVRVGRTPFDLFLLTEYRDVDFAYPWAKLPQEVYGLLPPRNMDGIDIIYRRTVESVEFRTKLSYGRTEYNLNDDFSIDMNDFFNVSAELGDYHWSAAIRYTRTTLDNLNPLVSPVANTVAGLQGIWNFADTIIEDFSVNQISAEYLSIGGRYDWDNLTVYTELARVFGDESELFKQVNNGYISLSYRTDVFEHFIGFAYTNSDSFTANIVDDLAVPIHLLPIETIGLINALDSQLKLNLNGFSPNQHTFSIGTRWNYSQNVVFKAQIDTTSINAFGDTFWENRTPSSTDRAVRTFFLNMSFAY